MARTPIVTRDRVPEPWRAAFDVETATTLMGYYALLAFNANAFETDLPAERTEPVLPI